MAVSKTIEDKAVLDPDEVASLEPSSDLAEGHPGSRIRTELPPSWPEGQRFVRYAGDGETSIGPCQHVRRGDVFALTSATDPAGRIAAELAATYFERKPLWMPVDSVEGLVWCAECQTYRADFGRAAHFQKYHSVAQLKAPSDNLQPVTMLRKDIPAWEAYNKRKWTGATKDGD